MSKSKELLSSIINNLAIAEVGDNALNLAVKQSIEHTVCFDWTHEGLNKVKDYLDANHPVLHSKYLRYVAACTPMVWNEKEGKWKCRKSQLSAEKVDEYKEKWTAALATNWRGERKAKAETSEPVSLLKRTERMLKAVEKDYGKKGTSSQDKQAALRALADSMTAEEIVSALGNKLEAIMDVLFAMDKAA